VREEAGTARRQFRVLHREFLLRIIDRELLSSHAQGDAGRLLLQGVSLLIFISILRSPARTCPDDRAST
jgi:hypothetical protein